MTHTPHASDPHARATSPEEVDSALAEAWWGGWTRQRRSVGPRLNGVDLCLLAGAALLATATHRVGVPLGWFVLWTFLCFLVFCNLVRIARSYELIWCALVVTTALGAMALGWTPEPAAGLAAGAGTIALPLLVVIARARGHLRGLFRR